MAIYHMIKKEEDFHPIDQEEIIQNSRKTKGLNLTNVIAFLKEQGADKERYMASLMDDKTLLQLTTSFIQECNDMNVLNLLQREIDKKKVGK